MYVTFFTNTIDSSGEMSCPTITSAVCLKHIKVLMNGLYERQHGGDAFHDLGTKESRSNLRLTFITSLQCFVDAKYREPLTQAQIEALRKCAQAAKDLPLLVNTLYDFLLMLKGETLF
jgi:hypothetical protein